MKHPTITITGAILAADLLNAIEQNDGISGQNDKDFGLPKGEKAKDVIARVYADARFYWQGFQRQMERLDGQEKELGTSETRKFWMIPFLTMLGYDPVFSPAERVHDKSYPISHRDPDLDQFPIHIVSYKDSLDSKVKGRMSMSPHATVQEYLNLTEHLYGIVTNGLRLRLLRDSSRLVKLSYLEFDLERLFEEEHYADFALLYRLLHQSRMPRNQDGVAECLMEEYHQQALASGSRIRDGLSKAVEASIKLLGNGFLQHPDNQALRQQAAAGHISAEEYYNWLLRLIYRMLFLMVIEERNLVYNKDADPHKRKIYYDYYSLQRLRQLSEHRFLADARFQDYWQSLRQTFRLFAAEQYGQPLELKPLAGGLFGYPAIGALNTAALDNAVLLQVLRKLNVFSHPDTGQKIRVNYGALNVEEFGSVYEGLLEYDPVLKRSGPGPGLEQSGDNSKLSPDSGKWRFDFIKGDARSRSGSHYTPDELVAPLIEHSLDYLIEDRLKEAGWTVGTQNPDIQARAERALLGLTVCDVACGSGHILLNAARRIAQQLALVQTGDEQPTPEAQRLAIRQVIRSCIYGVDLNPLAVELCKVALWLEAHNPGEPLNFLDHHIKCGNSIVGAGRLEDLMEGIPDEAFQNLTGFSPEEKEVAALLRKSNKKQREDRIKRKQLTTAAMQQAQDSLSRMAGRLSNWEALPENTPEDIEAKAKAYEGLLSGAGWYRLKQLADTQAAQFFLPKKDAADFVTDQDYFAWLYRSNAIQDRRAALAVGIAEKKRFFHWFLEFPEVFARGGFDCILGNPPFLGNRKITGAYGLDFAEYIRWQYAPIGSVDLVAYFFRRIFEIIQPNGFQSLISTNTIAQGNTREGGLAVIHEKGGAINHAVRSMRWPGTAAVEVSLVTIRKGPWKGPFVLNRKEEESITTYLDSQENLGKPYQLATNKDKSFQGSIVLGQGFVLEPSEALALIEKDPKNKEVLFPYLNGQDLNSNVDQSPGRWVINFFDWPEEKAKAYPDCYGIIEELVKPERTRWEKDKSGNDIVGKYALRKPLPQKWWVYADKRPKLYRTIAPLERVLVVTKNTKYCCFSFSKNDKVFTQDLTVFAYGDYLHFTIFNSTVVTEWAWKNSATLGSSTIRLNPSAVFETFAFPENISTNDFNSLARLGASYEKHRAVVLSSFDMGFTAAYNQFHNPQLTAEAEDISSKEFQKRYGKESWNLYNHLDNKKAGRVSYAEAVPMIEELRRLHQEMDEAVLSAYGWQDIALRHDFYEVDYLPENDNIRYTIHPEARREVLKRLLLLNHERYAEEVEQGLHGKGGKGKGKAEKGKKEKKSEGGGQGTLF
ncbi:MAG: restriction endonuclease [Lewinellaceae bacterium]|nr:restriction endonuclease [Lewinellaceae bacterium]